LAFDLPPNKLNLFFPFRQLFLIHVSFPVMDLSKHIGCLSQWPAYIAPGLPTYGALFLLATGGLVIARKVWTFMRVLLSLFVLPGKPVRNIDIQAHKFKG
jgi:hypothetical protein